MCVYLTVFVQRVVSDRVELLGYTVDHIRVYGPGQVYFNTSLLECQRRCGTRSLQARESPPVCVCVCVCECVCVCACVGERASLI